MTLPCDPDLLAAVAAGLYRAAAFDPDAPWPPLFPGEDREYERLGSCALAAAGRVLARTLHMKASAPGSDAGPYGGDAHLCADSSHDDRFCMECDRMNAGLLVAAGLVLAACGVPEGDEGGEQR